MTVHNCKVDIADYKAKLAEHNTRLVESIGHDRATNTLFSMPTLTVEKINKRDRVIVTAMPSYCPWCGESMS